MSTASETVWVRLTGADLYKVLSRVVANRANENTGDTLGYLQNLDPEQANRMDDLVSLAVQECRARIRLARSSPLSVETDTVPPEAQRHCLNIAMYQLVSSTPKLEMFIYTERGMASPLSVLYQEAMRFFDSIAEGRRVTEPSYPTGADYVNPVSDDNPAISSVYWADMYATGAEYRQGERIDPTTGTRMPLPLDMTTW